jgi:DNA polymerase-1
MFAGLPKALDFQASLYCDQYKYWKDDGKTWAKNTSEDQLWSYNCEDDIRTRECGEKQLASLSRMGLEEQNAFQQKMFYPVLRAMNRGVRVDKKRRTNFAVELQQEIAKREQFFQDVLGHPLNPRSAPQMTKLFYNDFFIKPIWSRATKTSPSHVTCDDKALEQIKLREPIVKGLINAIQEYRSLGVFLSTFVLAPLDSDGRMRCSYNICGTESFRLSSSENAFGSGGNMQNVPMGGEDDTSELVLPNVRKIYVPDEGFTIFDTDLSKADLEIVAWESDENELKAMLAEGRDPYVETAREFYHDPTITKKRSDGSANPKYKIFKSFAHGTHYLGTPQGLSGRLGLTVREAEKTQAWYFGKYPKIKQWQNRIIDFIKAKHYVQNAFGFRRHYFGRIDEATFREAIAWIPQSTVALYINRIWLNLYEQYPTIEVLLQVHDSLVGQFPSHLRDTCLENLRSASQVVIPYKDPLIIPVGVKTSTVSWGDCE